MVQTRGFSPHFCSLITVIKRYIVICSYFCLSFWGRSISHSVHVWYISKYTIFHRWHRYTVYKFTPCKYKTLLIMDPSHSQPTTTHGKPQGFSEVPQQDYKETPEIRSLWCLVQKIAGMDLFKVTICLGFTPFICHDFGVQRHSIPILDVFRR